MNVSEVREAICGDEIGRYRPSCPLQYQPSHYGDVLQRNGLMNKHNSQSDLGQSSWRFTR